jgi:hypothetical protein
VHLGLRLREQELCTLAQTHNGWACDQCLCFCVAYQIHHRDGYLPHGRLMLRPLSLMTVRDLRAAYHLVKYGGCNGMASFFLRWITNHSGTGYVAKRSMRAGCDQGSCSGFGDNH